MARNPLQAAKRVEDVAEAVQKCRKKTRYKGLRQLPGSRTERRHIYA